MNELRSGDKARTHVLTDDGQPMIVTVIEIYADENVALVSLDDGSDPYEVSMNHLDPVR